MDSEDSDTHDETCGDYPELLKQINIWTDVISSDTRRKSLERVGKVYFYSPIIFGEDHFSSSWMKEVTKNLLIDVRCDLHQSQANKFLTQMDLLESAYRTVWGTLRECCEVRNHEVAGLLHFANHCEHESSITVILEDSETTPLFDSMRHQLDNSETAKLVLLLCIKYYFFILEMVVIKKKDPEKALNEHPKKTLKKIEDLKGKGNALFQKNRYRRAIQYYSDAINIDCYNPVLYCNRAQANLYLDENWEALLDAKRAILLNPTWPKAHYRFSQALFELDFTQRAIKENRLGQRVCRDADRDIKDLQSQLKRILDEEGRIEFMKKNGSLLPPASLQEPDYGMDESSSNDDDPETSRPASENTLFGMLESKRKVLEQMNQVEAEKKKQEKDKRERQKREKEEVTRRVREEEAKRAKERKRERERLNRRANEEEKRRIEEEEDKKKSQLSKREKKRQLIKDRDYHLERASTALLEGRARQAYEYYQEAKKVMEDSTGKYGSLTEGGRVIFLYAQGIAALETANPQLFPVAMEMFDEIITQHSTFRTALPYYGKARALYLMNKFQEALSPIENGCVIAEKFPCSVETWPGVNLIIENTESASKMLKSLKVLRDQCLNPPPPEATCRQPECDSAAIYFNDIEFVGFVRVRCSDNCRVDYHIECWRKLRTELKRKTDKDMLNSECCTPDCPGLIQDVATFGADALVKSQVTRREPRQEKVKTVKPTSKQTKKEKKAKKGKSRDKVHKEGNHHQEPDPIDANESTAGEVQPVVTAPPVLEPAPEAPSTVERYGASFTTIGSTLADIEAEADTRMLHQEPAYILKKDSPDEERKLQSKSGKTKSKKKKEVITLEQRFYDQDNRYLMTEEDAPEPIPDDVCLGYQSGASAQSPWAQHQSQLPVIILSEEERSQVLVLQIHFIQILEDNGPLKINDPILIDEVKRLPQDSQELVSRHGGLAAFLSVSEDIDMVENYVCRSCDRSKCETIVAHQKVVWTPLPQPGAPPAVHRQSAMGQNRPSWGSNQLNADDHSNEPEPKMNTLDTFNDSNDSDGTVESSDDESMLCDGDNDDDEDSDSTPSGVSSTTPQSVGEKASPQWTPDEIAQGTIIGEDLDGELDQLLSAERIGDIHIGADAGCIGYQESNGGSSIFPELERYSNFAGPIPENTSAEQSSVPPNGLDQESRVDMARDGSYSYMSDMHDKQVGSLVDCSDGNVNSYIIGNANSVSYGKGDVSVGTPRVLYESSDGTCVDYGLVSDNGDGNKPMVENKEGKVLDEKLYDQSQNESCSSGDLYGTSAEHEGNEVETVVEGVPSEPAISGPGSLADSDGSRMEDTPLEVVTRSPDGLEAQPRIMDDHITLTMDEQIAAQLDGESAVPIVTTLGRDSQSAIRGEDKQTAASQPGGKETVDVDEEITSAMDEHINTQLDAELCALDEHSVRSSSQPTADKTEEGEVTQFDSSETGYNTTAHASSVNSDDLLGGNHFDTQSPQDKLYQEDAAMRCNSGEGVSSTSSGVSSDSTISSSEAAALQERLARCVVVVRKVAGLCPDLESIEEDDEALLNRFSDHFYKYVEALKESAVQPEQKSIATSASVEVTARGQNTDPMQTYEMDYQQAERKCQNLQVALQDTFTKNNSLEQLLSMAQSEKITQNQVVEDLQTKLRSAEEKMKEVAVLREEKSRLLIMVHDLETQARATQNTQQEYDESKEILNQTRIERDNLASVKAELEKKVTDLSVECQQQRQRANKSEVSIVQIHKEQALKPLTEAIKECEFHVRNLQQVLSRDPNPSLTLILNDWERCLEENKQKLETTTSQFDDQIQELHAGKVLTDLPVIPRPEPSRSKTLNKNPPTQWPRFGGPAMSFPPPRMPGFSGPPPPFRPPATVHLPPGVPSTGAPLQPPPQGLPQQQAPPQRPPQQPQGMPPRSQQGQPQMAPTAHPSSTSTTPPVTAHLPPARVTSVTPPAMPGATMPLAPGHGEVVQAGNSQMVMQQQHPIGTRSNPVNSGTVTRQADSPGMETATHQAYSKPSSVPPVVSTPVQPPGGLPVHLRSHPAHPMGGPQRAPMGHTGAAAGPRSSYQRLMDRLGSRFPAYNKIQLTNFLRIIRVNNGNSLSGLSMDSITQKVEELVAEAQAKIPQKPFTDGSIQGVVRVPPVAKIPAAPSQNPWSSLDDLSSSSWTSEVYDDEIDPCVICHEEMSVKEVIELECGHRFHADCIQEWLQTKSTCPNCRKFTKLKQDFPPLM